MAAEPALVPMPFCEQCWLDNHTNWEPESIDETGRIMIKLVGVDVPEITSVGTVDVCCICGSITIAGIYELYDPQKAYFVYNEEELEHKFELDFGTIEED